MTDSNAEIDEADDWDVPPWELPGNWRLDGEPHRATLLRRLANTSFLLAVASCYPFLFTCLTCLVEDTVALLLLGPAAVLALLALLLGLATARLATDDLARMARRLIDPNGDSETLFARRRAALGAGIGFGSVLLWGWLLLANALL